MYNIMIECNIEDNPDVELLIGADVYWKLIVGKVISLPCGLSAVETRLGWTLTGKLKIDESVVRNNITMTMISSLCNDVNLARLWDLEAIGIRDPVEAKTAKELEEDAHEHFKKTVTVNPEGRYEVQLPFIIEPSHLVTNRGIAEKRLNSTLKKLEQENLIAQYDQIFQEWEEAKIIETVESDLNTGHYLPHRAVVRESSLTTKLRPVFDANCKTRGNPSLNDCLTKGPNLIEKIPAIILRFREKRIGVVSDIRKAFLQISIWEGHRDYLRFLWRRSESEAIKVYRHCRVVFGVNCSPFLLGAVIKLHLKSSLVSEARSCKLLNSFYVDNCVTSLDTWEELFDFIKDAEYIFEQAKMQLCQWEAAGVTKSSFSELLEKREISRYSNVLGLLWNKEHDTLHVKAEEVEMPAVVTKRVVLSRLQRICDPMGFVSPVVLQATILLQEAWEVKLKWDESLTQELYEKFKLWDAEMASLAELGIPRHFGVYNQEESKWSLHVFCDASALAYAAVAFLRIEYQEVATVHLMMSKARVAPLKKITIPRLELLACVIGARLADYIVKSLNLQDKQMFFWSDSSTAIAWIKREDSWGTFVHNRVKEIRELTNIVDWRHVPGHRNPADLPSRGCSVKELLKSRWWEGPDWLKQCETSWPMSIEVINEEAISVEKKKTIVSATVTSKQPWSLFCCSTYTKTIRAAVLVMRWRKSILSEDRKISQPISPAEYEEAEMRMFLAIQGNMDIVESSYRSLKLVKDDAGLVRVKTKILERDDEECFLLPILLPGTHPEIKLLIRDIHFRNCYAGTQTCMRILRERFWITRSRQVIKKVISECKNCRIHTVGNMNPEEVTLPRHRVQDANVFQTVGVDLAGPLYLKGGRKVWILLFTCAVYRAVHLEVVEAVSTEAFMRAFRRFVARRIRPSRVYSDNGTNLVGAANLLRNLNWTEIKEKFAIDRMEWILIPPASPWWGGFWERLFRIIKGLLIRIIGNRTVDFEEISTIIVEIESVVNSRPLTYVSNDGQDLIPLTPNMFIKGVPNEGLLDFESANRSSLSKRYRYMLKITSEFRSRFRNEYLSTLKQKAVEKDTRKLQIGDVVLVGSDDKKRLFWPMGKIEELFPGRDGVIRVVKVKTAKGELVRSVQRIYPLEIEAAGQPREKELVKVVPEKEGEEQQEKTETV